MRLKYSPIIPLRGNERIEELKHSSPPKNEIQKYGTKRRPGYG
jgi:hypothetical protein